MAQHGPSTVPHPMSPSTPPTLATHHPLRSTSDGGRTAYDPYFDDVVIDPIQARLYNWLNGPTTLDPLEINSLVNNITFVIRSLQRNPDPDVGYSKVHESDLHVVTATENHGFSMSIFFGNHLICIGEPVALREEAMDGLRRRVEKMISSMVTIRAKAVQKHNCKNSKASSEDYTAQGAPVIAQPIAHAQPTYQAQPQANETPIGNMLPFNNSFGPHPGAPDQGGV